jgi:hypothetical protein
MTPPNPLSKWQRTGLALLAACGLAAAVAAPLVLTLSGTPLAESSYGEKYQVFELLGFSASVLLLAVATVAYRRRRPVLAADLVPLVVPLLLAFAFLSLFTEFSRRSWDYGCYQDAAQAVLDGRSPYGSCYIYPPLPAVAMANVHRLAAVVAGRGGLTLDARDLWWIVFYLYQWAQYLLVLAAYFLLQRLARRLGGSETIAAILPAVLLVASNPVLRTVRHNQVNLWVLDLSLAAILLLERRPALSGLAIAAATHVKLYPVVFLGVWGLARRWRFLAGSLAGMALLFAAVTPTLGGAAAWRPFLRLLANPQPGYASRDNSIHSLVANLYRFASGADAEAMAAHSGTFNLLASVISLALVAWLGVRYLRREGGLAALAGMKRRPAEDRAAALIAHAMDALAGILLVSPVVWEHHYVLALPLVVWGLVAGEPRRRPLVAAAALLMLALPTFDFFPFSYHRLAGLLLFLAATPAAMPAVPRRETDSAAPA